MGVAYRTAPRRRLVIPYDTATVVRLEEDSLLPVVIRGMSKAAKR